MRLGTALYTLLLVCVAILPQQAAAQVNPNPPQPRPVSPKAGVQTLKAKIKVTWLGDGPLKLRVGGSEMMLSPNSSQFIELRPDFYKLSGTTASFECHAQELLGITETGTGFLLWIWPVSTRDGHAMNFSFETQESYSKRQAKWTEAGQQAIGRVHDNMVEVLGGTFTMGCLEARDGECDYGETPAHQVTVSSFKIGKYEVTRALHLAVMKWPPPVIDTCTTCPTHLGWSQVDEFLVALRAATGRKGFRLPTEAEWEFAARGGTKSMRTKYAGSNKADQVALYPEDWSVGPIGTKAPNELGLYDMSGNIQEWCSDWFDADYYSSSTTMDPHGPPHGAMHSIRGGPWDHGPNGVRIALRISGDQLNMAGVRLALGE